MSMTAEQYEAWLTNECLRKNAYTKEVAREKAAQRRQATGENIRHYKCHHCGRYHIGHKRRKNKETPDTHTTVNPAL